MSFTFYVTSSSSTIIHHDIPLIVRGHDAAISRGSLKAVDRSVQESHTSAVPPSTKTYCGFIMKLCPRSPANLKQKLFSNSLKEKQKCQLYVCISVTSEATWGQAQQRWSCTPGSVLTGESGDHCRLWGGERADSRGTGCLPMRPACDCQRSTPPRFGQFQLEHKDDKTNSVVSAVSVVQMN